MNNHKIGFVGSFLGSHPGFPPDHAEILSTHLSEAGYKVTLTSTYKNRILRLLDIILTLLTWRTQVEIVLINVYSGKAFALADAASLMAKMLKIPIVFMLHGGNLPKFAKQHPIWVKRVLSRGNRFVAPSHYLANAFSSLCKVKIIPNMIDLDAYSYHPRDTIRPNMFWMRTFEDIYNPEMAIETLVHLKKDFPEAKLTMAGKDQGLLDSVRLFAKQQGLEADVRFAGYLNLAGKQHEFANHDIFLNTNRVDNTPVSLLEAASCGLPIVATKVGGIPYLFSHEHNALLVPDNDAKSMAQAIKRLLCEPGLAKKISKNGREIAQSSSWTHVRKEWDNLISDLLNVRQ